jgi:SpoVK/Ycf46/Vps4 family AAA+-type ATPase
VGSISFADDSPRKSRRGGSVTHNDDLPETESDNSIMMNRNQFDESFMYESSRFRNIEVYNPFAGLFYPEEVMTLLAQLELWYHRRDWYQSHSIPWRTGALLYGPGGTGKSSFAKATAEKLGIPLYQYSLNTLNDKEFQSEWDEMSTPCVVALEDFDTAFHGREPTTPHKSLSFECVLNQISGISAKEGVLLIVTTNHLEHIDPALGRLDENGRSTRPGRIDHVLHMGATTASQRKAIAEHVLGGLDPSLIEQALAIKDSMTAAQFQGYCVELALANMKGKP